MTDKLELKDFLRILRTKAHWIEGFADGIKSKSLRKCAEDIREFTNRFEKEQHDQHCQEKI